MKRNVNFCKVKSFHLFRSIVIAISTQGLLIV